MIARRVFYLLLCLLRDFNLYLLGYLSWVVEYPFSSVTILQPPVGCLLYTSDAADDLIGV